ncbi:fused MFS/spermidine synthase [Kiritimatiellaeota bacterium B1221]|nr:fused MFS/spermidine synthase [Kiritimatiellaeota bacterium B1221]
MIKHESVITEFNDVDVWEERDGTIDFNVIGATHATWHPVRLMTGHAWDAITAATLLHPAPIQNLLMLGLGGGTVLRQLRHFLPDAEFTAVEIDGEMIRLARKYMELDQTGVEVVHGDAFAFLETHTGKYDVIIDDLYRCGESDVERPAPVNAEQLKQHTRLLHSDGSLMMNFVVGRGHHSMHRSARKAYENTFSSIRAIRPPHSHNEVLAGTLSPLPLKGSRALRKVDATLTDASDQKYWKELRNLKLR